jgi:hypothetical protein
VEVIRSVWEAAFDPLRQNPNDSAVTLRDGENVYLVDRSLMSDLERIHDFLINLPLLARAVALEKVLYYLADALLARRRHQRDSGRNPEAKRKAKRGGRTMKPISR